MVHHTSGSIEGLLHLTNEELGKMFDNDPKGIRFDLETRQENGARFIPAEGCDNFDPLRGCLGHGERVTEKVWINSSNLLSAQYDRAVSKLTVQFKNGSIYEYADVPENTWLEFFNAQSGGSYLAKYIAKKFPTSKKA